MAIIQKQRVRIKFSTIGKPQAPRIKIKPVSLNKPRSPNKIKLNKQGRATIDLAKLK